MHDVIRLTNALTACSTPWAGAGMRGLRLLKTTQSGYEGFLHDRFTLLPDTRERIMASSVTATWRCDCQPCPGPAHGGQCDLGLFAECAPARWGCWRVPCGYSGSVLAGTVVGAASASDVFEHTEYQQARCKSMRLMLACSGVHGCTGEFYEHAWRAPWGFRPLTRLPMPPGTQRQQLTTQCLRRRAAHCWTPFWDRPHAACTALRCSTRSSRWAACCWNGEPGPQSMEALGAAHAILDGPSVAA